MGATAERKLRGERKENADRRRRQILDAAMTSIVENGLARTTLATVATAAGLSQGVAVFYYKSKTGLLCAVLEDLCQGYEIHWKNALAAAGSGAREQLGAMVAADFSETVCSAEKLSVWFAFWGEQKFTPSYAAITARYDLGRARALGAICRRFFPEDRRHEGDRLAEWIDTLSDGYWQKIHLFPATCTREIALAEMSAFLAMALPEAFGTQP